MRIHGKENNSILDDRDDTRAANLGRLYYRLWFRFDIPRGNVWMLSHVCYSSETKNSQEKWLMIKETMIFEICLKVDQRIGK